MNTSQPPYSAQAVANSFLNLAGGADAAQISPMKMQKMIFFAHGWHLANFGKPLVREPVQAWQYGPVIESLYHDLKNFGSDPIDSPISSLSFNDGSFKVEYPEVASSETLELLQAVNDVYGKYSAIQLSNISHEDGSPWYRVKEQYGADLSQRSVTIPNSLIQEFYLKLLKESE